MNFLVSILFFIDFCVDVLIFFLKVLGMHVYVSMLCLCMYSGNLSILKSVQICMIEFRIHSKLLFFTYICNFVPAIILLASSSLERKKHAKLFLSPCDVALNITLLFTEISSNCFKSPKTH